MAQIAMLAFAAVSAISSIRQGQQQAEGYRFQAQQAELQGRQNALNYNRQALYAFERQQRLGGTIRARAAAGGIDPLTGSPLSVDQWNAERAGNEIKIARENAELAAAGGLAQSQQLYGAATVAEASGITSAIGKVGTAYAMSSQSATPSTGSAAGSSTSLYSAPTAGNLDYMGGGFGMRTSLYGGEPGLRMR
jgi:hypothetical protein